MKSQLDELFQNILWDIRKLLPEGYTNEILSGPNEYIFTNYKNNNEIRIHYLNNNNINNIKFEVEFLNGNNSYETYSFQNHTEMIKLLQQKLH